MIIVDVHLPRVHESDNVHCEGTVDGVHDGQFGQGLHHQVDHQTHNDETEKHRSRATGLEGGTRADKQTCTDCASAVIVVLVSSSHGSSRVESSQFESSGSPGHTHMAIICICLPLRLRCSAF